MGTIKDDVGNLKTDVKVIGVNVENMKDDMTEIKELLKNKDKKCYTNIEILLHI